MGRGVTVVLLNTYFASFSLFFVSLCASADPETARRSVSQCSQVVPPPSYHIRFKNAPPVVIHNVMMTAWTRGEDKLISNRWL